jgi:hypothetical protein
MRIPVFEPSDAEMFGWQVFRSTDGDMVLRVHPNCICGCEGRADACDDLDCRHWYALQIPPGAVIKHDPPGTLDGGGLLLIGPEQPPPHQEWTP